jgi:hypothetical protein
MTTTTLPNRPVLTTAQYSAVRMAVAGDLKLTEQFDRLTWELAEHREEVSRIGEDLAEMGCDLPDEDEQQLRDDLAGAIDGWHSARRAIVRFVRELQVRVYATGREESDYCEAGTQGCSIAHSDDEGGCESW